jgi:hypothetical protein
MFIKEMIGLFVSLIGITSVSMNLISGALASNTIDNGNTKKVSDYNIRRTVSQNSRYEIIDLVPVTVSIYAEGCGNTGACKTETDTQYIGIPRGCQVLGNPEIIRGEIFGRVSLPKTTYLPRGSSISESTLRNMNQSSAVAASVSAGTYGNYSGSYNDNFASRDSRSGSIVTNVDMVRVEVSATGRRAFWRGAGSKAEYTLKFKARCVSR